MKDRKEAFEKATKKRCDEWWQKAHFKSALGKITDSRSVEQMLQLLKKDKCEKAIDIGCGNGKLITLLTQKGVHTTAIDASSIPLDKIQNQVSTTFRASFPYLGFLEDQLFGFVICLDTIAELPQALHRLALSELARLIKPDGWALLSTPLDVHTDDALGHFRELVETEFEIKKMNLSYHRMTLFLLRFPPFYALLQRSKKCVLFLEILSRTFFGQFGVSHVILAVKRKKLF